jgi:hypothetical protein
MLYGFILGQDSITQDEGKRSSASSGLPHQRRQKAAAEGVSTRVQTLPDEAVRVYFSDEEKSR